MTIARKISALFLALALLLGCFLTAYTAHREAQLQLQKTAELALARVQARADLQVYLYQNNVRALERSLGELLKPGTFSFAVAYTNQGDLLARQDRTGAPRDRLPPFKSLRAKSSAAETSELALNPDHRPVSTGLWSSMTQPDSLVHLVIPVFSSINPTTTGLNDSDIARAIFKPRVNNTSQVVIGYIHLGIALGQSVSSAVSQFLLWYLAIVGLLGIAVLFVARDISSSISRLAELTQVVTSGRRGKTMAVGGGPDLENIETMLNAVIDESSQRKSEAHMNNQILSLKVDERSSQLTEKEQQLDSAVQEISRAKSQLHNMAYYDSLTALPNRRLFTEQLALLLRLNQRNKTSLALLLINLENFKRINDSLGHGAGDLVLREVARRLNQCLRGSDTVAYEKESKSNIDVSRTDGDEFTVVLNQLSSADDMGLVAQRLVDILLEPMVIDGTELVVIPNIGIAVSPGDSDQVQELFTAARAAMHHAKSAKQEHFVFYQAEMDAAGAERIQLETDLRKAVERGELLLHYQPQVDTVSGSVTSAEALLRWEHPEYGLVPPHKFIAIAEEIGLIAELGDWVLLEACQQMKAFADRGLKLPKIAINISAMQFNSTFTRRVRDVLQKVKLPPAMLELGLAESIMTENDGSTTQALQDLKDRGVYLSVDDFGTSYSPMNYLSHYPLDEIKIDRSFIAGCDQGDGDARLVAAIISMAASLNLKTVAEGVETVEQYRFLKSKGATVMQGYFFSKPVAASELEGMLTPWYFAEQIQQITV